MNERQTEIFNLLSKEPKMAVKDISLLLGVSEVTIRKDLSALENEKLVKRTHGGAVQIATNSIEKRMLFRYDIKLKLAKEAAKLILDGETVLIEAGSTNAMLAKELSGKKGVHIITNSSYIAQMLKSNTSIKVTLLGGEFQPEAEALVGPLTKLCLSKIGVDKAFIGMDGFSDKFGFTCGDFSRAEVGKEMCERAEKVVILADSCKFDDVGLTTVAEFSQVWMVITDQGIHNHKIEVLKSHGIKTIIVNS